MQRKKEKPCQCRSGCAYDAIPGEKFCPCHRRAMIREMEQSGYLAPLPDPTPRRRKSARENVNETKFGPAQ